MKRSAKTVIILLVVLALIYAGLTVFRSLSAPVAEEPELQQGESIQLVDPQAQPQNSAVDEPEANSPPENEVTEPGALDTPDPEEVSEPESTVSELLPEDGSYYSKDDVALYIHQYGKLPGNYITKKEAEKLGWSGGSLEKYAPGKVIGGSQFGNREGLLPAKKGRVYYECDIYILGEKKRGAKRIIYSNDGLIYYTDDHYESFELLYGEE